MPYLIENEDFAKLREIERQLYGNGSSMTPDTRRDLANLLNLINGRAEEVTHEEAAELEPGNGQPRTNEQLLAELMNFNPAGALCQGFIIHALRDYADRVAITSPERFDNAMMSGAAWVKCAKHISQRMREFYEAPAKRAEG